MSRAITPATKKIPALIAQTSISHQVCQIQPNLPAVYIRHRPETTLLYQIIQEYWPEFQAELASYGRYLPAYVTKEFDE